MEGPRIGHPESLIVLVVFSELGPQVWALADMLQVWDDSRFQTGTRLIWVRVVLLLGRVGALI